MKKMNDIFMTISIFIVTIVGIFGFIYEYVIWDKSIVPDWLFNAFSIPGYIALAILIITFILQKRIK